MTTTNPTACILCSQNCGIEIQINEAGEFEKILGDESHPVSEGYLCQKATRLNYYQQQVRQCCREVSLQHTERGEQSPRSFFLKLM